MDVWKKKKYHIRTPFSKRKVVGISQLPCLLLWLLMLSRSRALGLRSRDHKLLSVLFSGMVLRDFRCPAVILKILTYCIHLT